MSMARFPLLILVFLFFTFKSFAQKSNEKFSPVITLRTNLFSFAESDAGIMLGIGYQWSRRFSATLDPTFIFFNPYQSIDDNGQPFGIKIRTDIRLYFDKFILGLQRIFIAPELHFKHITTKKWATFGINCIGQSCSYYMYDIYKEVKNEIGAALKMGIITQLDKKKRWILEFYGGLGFKVNYFKDKDVPLGGLFMPEPSHTDIFFGFPENVAVPIFPGSIKISYCIR